MMPVGRDFRLIERERKLREHREELSEERLEDAVEKIKNPPSLSFYLVETVHEELALKQMQKYFNSKSKKDIDLFWKNQKRFLDKLGLRYYISNHDKFLKENPEYAAKFKDMNFEELKSYRANNQNIYNDLCRHMNNLSPRYLSLDGVLIPAG